MPFSPSDYEWWMWLLFALGAAVVLGICGAIAVKLHDEDHSISAIVFGLPAIVAGVAGVGCLLIAIIRFVKWVWG